MDKRKGFTLIELLVVISIIVLLLALTVPVLSKAKEQVRLVICKNNMRQVAIAINLYANTNDDKVVPGDFEMGHDIWNLSSEGPNAWKLYDPVNLGHLLESGILPMPAGPDHVFYCPTMSRSEAPWGFRYEDYGPHADSDPRGFGGWGQQDRLVNIGYEYRDSIDGPDIPNPIIHLSDISSKSLVSDIVSWGSGRWVHKNKYNFCRADGSAETFNDCGEPEFLYETFRFSADDQLYFDIFDH